MKPSTTTDEESVSVSVNEPLITKTEDLDGGAVVSVWSWRALFSHDEKLRRKSRLIYCGATSFFVVSLLLMLTFLVIIPSVVRGMVDSTPLTINSAMISNPNDDFFHSTVVQSMAAGPIPATLQFNSLTISWDESGGGDLLSLSECNELSIEGDKPLTMNAKAHVQNVTALKNFNKFSVHEKNVQWNIHGKAVVTAIIPVSVDIRKTVTLSGFNGFPIAPVIHDVTTTGGTSDGLMSTIHATLTSVSNIAMEFDQDLYFDLYSNDTRVGLGVIRDATFALGSFNVTIESTLFSNDDPQSYDELMRVVSRYASGQSSPISLRSFYTPRVVTWLQPALSSLDLESHIPGIKGTFLQEIFLYIPTRMIFQLSKTYVHLLFSNPIDIPIEIVNIYSKVYCNITGENVFFSTMTAPNVGLKLAPNSMGLSRSLYTTPVMSDPTASTATLDALLAAKLGYFYVESDITFVIGDGFAANITYISEHVLVNVTSYAVL